MPRDKNATVGGIKLIDLDPRIVVNRITEKACTMSPVTVDRGNGIGADVLAMKRQYIDVTVEFNFLELKRNNVRQRAALLDNVAEWAMRGGWLEVSHRGPDKRLRVKCVTLPSLGDPKNDWFNDYSVVFRSFTVPYWLSQSAVTVAPGGAVSGANLKFSTANTAPTPVAFSVKPSTGTLTTVTFTFDSKVMKFTGLNVPAGNNFEVFYTEDGVQTIGYRYSTKMFDKRTIDSVDDIILPPGGGTVKFSANTPCIVSASVNERWV